VTTQSQTIACAAAWAECAGIEQQDRYLIASPFAHTFGYKAGLVVCLLRGATMYPLAVFDVDEAVRLLEEDGITVVPGPPTILQSLADRLSAGAATRWRVAVTGSATVPVSLVERLQREICVDTVLTAYGLTEAVVVSMCRPGDPPDVVARSAGRPVAAFEVRVRRGDGSLCRPGEQGEIELRGPNLMVGYLDDPRATAAAVDPDGWFRTGDIGSVDDAGYLSITDRIKNMFTVGGFNVYPAEVERVLTRLEGVVECAVIGVPDDRLGAVSRAFVVRAPGSELTADEVVAHCGTRLANFKVPRSVVFVDALPRSFAGKVVTQELSDLSEAHPGRTER
jgi:acyl-CoA synthetase (AMP-forming)/AMP-acid ligase II